MNTPLTLTTSIFIKASVDKVWEALTNPDLIKIYFFGTECITDWQKGSPIVFRGVWDNQPYEDKGIIREIEINKCIVYSYWSSFAGTPDTPENYAEIKYELAEDTSGTTLTIHQNGFQTEGARDHSLNNWGYILDGIKKLMESV